MSTQESIKQNRVGFKRNAEGEFEPYLDESIPAIVDGVGQTAPRVTIEQIEAEIARETYSKPFDETGVGAAVPDTPENRLDETLTCAIVLKSGWGVYGNGRAAAIEQLHKLSGFELAQKLYREKQAG